MRLNARRAATGLAFVLLAGAAGGIVTAPASPVGAQTAPPPTQTEPEPTPGDEEELTDEAAEQIAAIQEEKEERTPAETKVDSNLLYAANEEAGLPAVDGAPDLESSADVDGAGRTEVDIAGDVDAALLDRIEDLGGRIVDSVPEQDAVRAVMPVEAIVALAAEDEVRTITEAGDAMVNAAQGAAANQAVATHGVDQIDDELGIDGTGVKACVLSDGVSTLPAREASGDLPIVDVLPGQAGTGDEGTAMLELIHDMAPGAELGFATAFGSQAGFAQNIIDLRADGCDVIVDDVTYYTEGAFQDDDIAQAISQVKADGAVYFTSAGNSGNLADGTSGTWQGDFEDAGTLPNPQLAGLRVHGWGVAQTSNLVTGGLMQPVTLQWADPLGASSNDYDLFVLGSSGSVIKTSSTNQTGTQDPYERVEANTGQRIVVAKAAGAADRYLAVYTNRGLLDIATGGAAYGHNASEDAISVAATPAVSSIDASDAGPYPGVHTSADVSEEFSSDGPARTFYEPNGTPVSGGPSVRNGVDLTAADGVATTAPMFTTFFGTSAAAPNAASLAVLALSADSSLTPDEVEDALIASAVDIEATGVDTTTGAGVPLAPALMSEIGMDDAALVIPGERTVTEVVGDADSVYEPGEVFEIEQELLNPGTAPATSVSATLSTTSTSVVVTSASDTYGTIAEDGAADGTFRIRILKTCVCGEEIPFQLTTTYGGGLDPSRTFDFGLTVGTDGTPTAAVGTGLPLAIPDRVTNSTTPVPVSTTFTVGAIGGPLRDLALTFGGSACSSTAGATTVGLTHSYVGDLVMSLTSPEGTTVAVTTKTSNSGNNLCNTTFSDAGTGNFVTVAANQTPFTGSYRPASPFAAFDGEDAQGTWTLTVADHRTGDTGTLRDVSLTAIPASCDHVAPAPTAVDDELGTPYETPLEVAAPGVLGNDVDAYGDELEAELVDDVDHGTLDLDADGGLVYTPDTGFDGDDTFTYIAKGSESDSAPATVTITVDPNTAPTVGDDAYETLHGEVLTVTAPGVLGDDDDLEGHAMTAELDTDVAHGVLSLAADGSFTYTPDDGFSGDDTFTYVADDGLAESDPATVTITVAGPVGPAPVAVIDRYTTPLNTTYTAPAPGVLFNDDNLQPATTTLASVVTAPTHGTLTLAADGSFTYVPTTGWNGTDSFSYKVRTGGRWSSPVTSTIRTGRPTDAGPTARPDAFAIVGGETNPISRTIGLKLNDIDPDGDALYTFLVDDVDHGTLTLHTDGGFVYTPDDGFRGTDTFTYEARDDYLASSPATVTLTVTSGIDAWIPRAVEYSLGRPATPTEVQDWIVAIDSGAETRTSFVEELMADAEHAEMVVERAFATYLGRTPTSTELGTWTTAVINGLSEVDLPVVLVGSPDGVSLGLTAPGDIIDAMYQAILGRAPTSSQRTSGINALNNGSTVEALAQVRYDSSEGQRRRIAFQYQWILGRAPTTTESNTWVSLFGAGKDDVDVAVSLLTSAEYVTPSP